MKPGELVHVASLGKGILREIRNGGRCLVEIRGRSMLVQATQLSRVEVRRVRATTSAEAPGVPETLRRPHAATTLDLHGMTTDEAIAALDAFIDDAILGGLAEVRVIHGRSGGRLKAAVHTRLRVISTVRAFRLDSGNPGVTVVGF